MDGRSSQPLRLPDRGGPASGGIAQTDQPADDSDLNKAYAGLERLVKKLEPTGKYAMMIARDVSSSGVHLAFELEGDARRFAAAINAEVTEGYGGSTHPSRASRAPTDGPPDGLPPNACAPSPETDTFPANLGLSTATDVSSRFAMPMAATCRHGERRPCLCLRPI